MPFRYCCYCDNTQGTASKVSLLTLIGRQAFLSALLCLLILIAAQSAAFTCCVYGIQVLQLLRQMEATNTQATASKVSLLMLGQQAVMDAYLCLLHLTTGVSALRCTLSSWAFLTAMTVKISQSSIGLMCAAQMLLCYKRLVHIVRHVFVSKVLLLMLVDQAVLKAYLCLLYLTTGVWAL